MVISPITVTYHKQLPGLQGVQELIELAGRTCYESRDKIIVVDGVSQTAPEFCNKLLKVLKHQSVAEHATIYLETHNCPREVIESPYSIIRGPLVTTNYRVLLETGNEHLVELSRLDSHEKRYTFEIHCGIDISREILRHRCMSFTERSTRYVKLDNLPVSKPEWVDLSQDSQQDELWYEAMKSAENFYKTLIELGWKPEHARKVLPLGTETCIWVTASESQWKRFIDLRLHNTSGKAHPDIQEVARQINEIMESL